MALRGLLGLGEQFLAQVARALEWQVVLVVMGSSGDEVVEHHSAASEQSVERMNLLPSGVGTIGIALQHPSMITGVPNRSSPSVVCSVYPSRRVLAPTT